MCAHFISFVNELRIIGLYNCRAFLDLLGGKTLIKMKKMVRTT